MTRGPSVCTVRRFVAGCRWKDRSRCTAGVGCAIKSSWAGVAVGPRPDVALSGLAEAMQDILQQLRNGALPPISPQAAAKGDRSDRKHCAPSRRLKIDDLATHQFLRQFTRGCLDVGE